MSNKYNILLILPPMSRTVDKDYVSTQMPVNLAYIASSLEKAGANVKIIDFTVESFSEQKLISLLQQFNPAIVGFTSMTSSIYMVTDLAKIVKTYNKDILTLLGGVHISAMPQQTLEENPYIDVGVIGEGEETAIEIYNLKKTGKSIEGIKGTAYREEKKIIVTPRRELIKDLNSIPFPARHLLDLEKYQKSHVSRGFSRKHLRIMEIITSRGCPNSCIFCAGHINYGCSLRFRSYKNITDEVDYLIDKYNINHISIEDDTFTINKTLLKNLCDYFRRKKLTWNCNARVNTIDLEILKLMKQSGCKKISFGVESGSPRILKLIKKNISLDQVRNAFKSAKKEGIRYIEGTFMLGSHPDEKLEDIEMTKKLIFELMPDFISLSLICPFPGTEVYNIMKKNNLLDKDLDWSKFTFINNKPPFMKLNHLTAEQLIKIQKNTLKKYYSSPKYILGQVTKIRTLGELLYFINLGFSFVFDFLFKK